MKYSRYPPPPVHHEVLYDAGQNVALLHPNDRSKICPTVWTPEGDVWGVIHHGFQTAHTQAVSTGQLPGVRKYVLAYWAHQYLLQLCSLYIFLHTLSPLL